MAQASVKTVQYMDPRIEPQPDPVYDYVIGPTQNQYYKIPASGLSDSSITFNNLTTLGVDRAYLDTFELEITAEITFNVQKVSTTGKDIDTDARGEIPNTEDIAPTDGFLIPRPSDWTFESFPFNKCCDEARVNINGGAFFSQPMSYIRAKERYMNQYELSKCYENICPCHKALGQTESGRTGQSMLDQIGSAEQAQALLQFGDCLTADTNGDVDEPAPYYDNSRLQYAKPTRLAWGHSPYGLSDQGLEGGYNNSIVRTGKQLKEGDLFIGYQNYHPVLDTRTKQPTSKTVVTVTWREPVFCSPFSSRYDGTYGRPLYNITSMDLAFTMQDLGNMIRIAQMTRTDYGFVESYSVHISACQLCYQVMTIPPILNKPLTTLVPYRRFVPYVTDYNKYAGVSNSDIVATIDGGGFTEIEITSGVYTLNEIPTAIWIYFAPTKAMIQSNQSTNQSIADFGFDDNGGDDDGNDLDQESNKCSPAFYGNWDSNKQFAFLEHLNISLANTTQILNTASDYDLYRIAKANGCEDSFFSWGIYDAVAPICCDNRKFMTGNAKIGSVYPYHNNCGSVIRLKPGVDLIVPDQPLIPGANANNMVFQVSGKFMVPPHSNNIDKYALWILFEYVGVAAISPGQCEITMNPLGSGEVMAVSPVMSATSDATEGNLEGSGFWDGVKKVAKIAAQIGDSGVISKILKKIPGASGVGDYMEKHGFGEPATKRNCRGGAVMGRGLNDWV